jgi:hypothetical protein
MRYRTKKALGWVAINNRATDIEPLQWDYSMRVLFADGASH